MAVPRTLISENEKKFFYFRIDELQKEGSGVFVPELYEVSSGKIYHNI